MATTVPNGTFQQTGSSSTRSLAGKLADTISAGDFGAVGDGVADDHAAVQDAIDATGQVVYMQGKTLTLAPGVYRLVGGLASAQFWRVDGAGPLSSYFLNGGAATDVLLAGPAIKPIGFVDYDDFGGRGFQSFFACGGDTDSLRWSRIHAFGCAGAAFEFKGKLQVATWDQSIIEQCQYGIVASGGIANNVDLRAVQFKDLTDSAIKLNHSENFLMVNCRFEGAGVQDGKAIIDLTGSQHLIVAGGYFEGSRQYVLRWRGGAGLVGFDGVHFTFNSAGVPYGFDTDGGVAFRNCDFAIPTRPPASATIEGVNRNLQRCEYSGSLRAPHGRPGAFTGSGPFYQEVLRFIRRDPTNTPENSSQLIGMLRYTVAYASADGGVAGRAAREYRVAVTSFAGNPLSVSVELAFAHDEGSAGPVIAIGAGPATATPALDAVVRTVWNGVDPRLIAYCTQGLTFSWEQSCGLAENTFEIVAA